MYTLSAIISCAAATHASANGNDMTIKNSLRPPVVFSDSSRWHIADRMAHHDVPGVSVAVIENYEIVLTESYGFIDESNSTKTTNQTLFQVGSLSKPVAAYAALLLAQEGLVDLDQPANDYLTSWKIPQNSYTAEHAVTTGSILAHRAGLSVHGFAGYPKNHPLPDLIQILNGTLPAQNDPIVVNMIPGTSQVYSGGGYTVLQQLMIDVEDSNFPDLMAKRMLTPLRMKQSTFDQDLPAPLAAAAAAGYRPDGTWVAGKWHRYPEMAAAGLWSTASDMARFLNAILRTTSGLKTGPLTKKYVDRMIHPLPGGNAGLGLFRRTTYLSNDRYFEHTGWDEGFCALMIGDAKTGNGAIVLINANQPDFIDELLFSIAEVYNWPDFALPVQKAKPFTPDEIRSIAGNYRYSADTTIGIYHNNGKMYFKYSNGDPIELLKTGDNLYLRRGRENHITFVEDSENTLSLKFLNVDGSTMDAPLIAMNEN